MPEWRIAPLTAAHTRGVAECHIASWREAYATLLPRHLLDAFDLERHADQWARIHRRDPRATHIALVADTVIGFAHTGPVRDEPPVADRELAALYVREPWYGTGLADELLAVALSPTDSHSLWVFAEYPRALVFYRRHGFVPDGARRIEEFSPAPLIRMVRPPRI